MALAIRLLAFQGYSDSDPRDYTLLAFDLSHGQIHVPGYEGSPVFPLRWGVYTPVALLFKVFGVSEITIAIYPLVMSLLGIILGYAFGRMLWGPLAGLIASFLLSVIPMDMTASTILYPDHIAAIWANAGMFLLFGALHIKRTRLALLVGIFSGLAFGFSWLCKESVAYLVPIVAIILFLPLITPNLKLRISVIVAISIGAISVLAVEAISYYILTGDVLFRLHETERNYRQSSMWFFTKDSPYFGWTGSRLNALAYRLFWQGPKVLLGSSALAAVGAFGCLSVLIIFLKKLCYRWFILAWIGGILFIFNFGSSSFKEYIPLVPFARYLYPLVFPACLAIAGAITALAVGSFDTPRPQIVWSIVLFILFLCFDFARLPHNTWEKSEPVRRKVASQLRTDDLVFSDYRSASSITFYRFNKLYSDKRTIPYEGVSAASIPTGAYIFIDKNTTDFLEKSYKYEKMKFEDNPSENWKVIWREGNATLFRVE